MSQYSTNLTDKQWQVIEEIINPQERQRKHPLREIMNAILYINRTGCQWRMLPSNFAPWQTVYYYFRKWKLEGVIEDIMDTIHSLARRIVGREESPSKFCVIPKRWIVERTFSWLENFRRLTIDYEYLAETAEAMVQLACVQIMLNRFFV